MPATIVSDFPQGASAEHAEGEVIRWKDEFHMQCRNHPDREASVRCEKMEVGYCRECLENCEACTDPCGYCKFRPQCIIWELCRKSDKRYELEKEAKGL